MNNSAEASTLTEQLLATIRLQRHLGALIVISTQDPTISPKLLDLRSITIVYRFTSPDWFHALQRHLAGAPAVPQLWEKTRDSGDEYYGLAVDLERLQVKGKDHGAAMAVFAQIVQLRVGEALLFSPSAILEVDKQCRVRKLSHGVLKIRVRDRVTNDRGQSVMAD